MLAAALKGSDVLLKVDFSGQLSSTGGGREYVAPAPGFTWLFSCCAGSLIGDTGVKALVQFGSTLPALTYLKLVRASACSRLLWAAWHAYSTKELHLCAFARMRFDAAWGKDAGGVAARQPTPAVADHRQ